MREACDVSIPAPDTRDCGRSFGRVPRARASIPERARGSKPDAARKQAESLALSGVKGAAEAQATIFIATNVRERDQNPTHTTPALALTPSTPAASDLPQPKVLPRPGARLSSGNES